MTIPGGGCGESAHDDDAYRPPAGERAPERPAWEAPGQPPGYPPGYQGGYEPGYQSGYQSRYQGGDPPPYPSPPGYHQPPYTPEPVQFGGPPPSYPGGYYPTSEYPGGYGQQNQMAPGTNGLAIASLVSSFTGFLCCFIGSIVGIVLGAIALGQIKQTRQGGYGLAVAGIVIGIGTLLTSLIIAIFSIHMR